MASGNNSFREDMETSSVFEEEANGTSEDMASAISCTKCLEPYKFPKMLPHCGHSFCLDCVFKIAEKNTAELTCPECGEVSKIGSRGPQGFKTNLSLQRLVDKFKPHIANGKSGASAPAANGTHQASAEQPCFHVLLSKSRLSCRHCSQKFCESCEIVHKEWLKGSIFDVSRNFTDRRTSAVALAEETRKIAREFVENEAREKKEVALADCQRLRERLSNYLDQRQERILSEIKTASEGKLKEIDDIVNEATNSELPTMVEDLPFKSFNAVSLDEMAQLYEETMLVDKQLKALDTLGRDISSGKLVYDVKEKDMESNVVEIEKLLSLQPKIFWQSAENYEHEMAEAILSIWLDAIVTCDVDTMKDLMGQHDWSEKALRFIVESPTDKGTEPGVTAILEAASQGKVELVIYLVETCHANVFAKSSKGNTCLHLAAFNGHLEVVEYLCKFEPRLRTIGDNKNTTALHLAAGVGHLAVVDYMLKTPFDDVKATTASHRTVLHYAALGGHQDVVERLLESNLVEAGEIDAKGRTCLHLAATHGNKEVVRLLAKRYPNLVRLTDYSGKTAKDLAETEKHNSIVDILKK